MPHGDAAWLHAQQRAERAIPGWTSVFHRHNSHQAVTWEGRGQRPLAKFQHQSRTETMPGRQRSSHGGRGNRGSTAPERSPPLPHSLLPRWASHGPPLHTPQGPPSLSSPSMCSSVTHIPATVTLETPLPYLKSFPVFPRSWNCSPSLPVAPAPRGLPLQQPWPHAVLPALKAPGLVSVFRGVSLDLLPSPWVGTPV